MKKITKINSSRKASKKTKTNNKVMEQKKDEKIEKIKIKADAKNKGVEIVSENPGNNTLLIVAMVFVFIIALVVIIKVL